jgi:hypothetical protein
MNLGLARIGATLQEYAKLKDARGEPEQARQLAQKAAALTK